MFFIILHQMTSRWKQQVILLLMLVFGFLIPVSDVNLTFDVWDKTKIGALRPETVLTRIESLDNNLTGLQKLVDELVLIDDISVSVVQLLQLDYRGRNYNLRVQKNDDKWENYRASPFLMKGRLGSFYLPNYYMDPVLTPNLGESIRIEGTHYNYSGELVLLEQRVAVLIREDPPHLLKDTPWGTEILVYFDSSQRESVHATIQKNSEKYALKIAEYTAEDLLGEMIERTETGMYRMMKLSGLVLVSALANLVILLVSQFYTDRYENQIRVSIGAQPSNLFVEYYWRLFILFLLSAPIIALLLPIFARYAGPLPKTRIQPAAFVIYLGIGGALSVVYAGIVTYRCFVKRVIDFRR